jgi:hypothetical protein
LQADAQAAAALAAEVEEQEDPVAKRNWLLESMLNTLISKERSRISKAY